MKIAILKKDYDMYGGGAERYAVKACEGLAARGHDVSVLSETFNGHLFDNLRHVRVGRKIFAGFSRTTAFHREVQAALKPSEYDVSVGLSRTFPWDMLWGGGWRPVAARG